MECGILFAHLWGGGEGIGATLVGVVHELLQVLQVLQQQGEAELIGVVAIPITTRTSPCANILLGVQAVSSQATDHTWKTEDRLECTMEDRL